MPAPFLSAFELQNKTGIDFITLQAAIDAGCHCYSDANGAHVTAIENAPAPTPRGIDLNIYCEHFGPYEKERNDAFRKLNHIFFKPIELFSYIENEFGRERALYFWNALDAQNKEELALPSTRALPSGSDTSEDEAEAQTRIADLEGQLEEAMRERDVARKERDAWAARVAELEALRPQDETASPDCAACKAEDNHVEEWAKDVECAVALAVRVAGEGERKKTYTHKDEWKTIRGAVRQKAFAAFRRALPNDLKEDDPRQK
ncbi:MAG: hypothetical protein AAGU21_13755 [Solidesulfovibrio sp.]|uniref:hypothetical protein n=1 Tax=Solidesulfovibrio sp. TaxID=2910990 RepID=UPI002B1E90B3|nr:hypothetical protein [Solidesulfovibrio sp.]MEA4857752.1 hypothetical protein [Solidesulfovibrio sp.]